MPGIEEKLQSFSAIVLENANKQNEKKRTALEKEKKRQHAVIGIKDKYGKNAILKGMNLEEGATAKSRNGQIGGHKA